MKSKLLIYALPVILTVVLLGLGFSGNDDNPTSTSVTSPSKNIKVISGNNPDLLGAWTSGAAVPTGTYFGSGVGYTRGDSGWVFVIAGNGSANGINNIQKYNVRANTWSTVAPLPQALRLMGSAVVHDSIFSIGGINVGGTFLGNVYRYDINSNTWTARTNYPSGWGFGKAVGYQDSLIYAVGGYDGVGYLPNVRIYNTINGTWRDASPLPTGIFGGACTIVRDTIVYAGGAAASGIVATTYRGVIDPSDHSLITWTSGAPLPAGTMYRMDAHPWGNKGLILTCGSLDAAFTSVSNLCYTYSPGNDAWTPQPNKTTAWTGGQSGSVHFPGGIWKLVCASGYGGSAVLTSTEIFTDTLAGPPPPPVGNTLVLIHDSTIASTVPRKADRDTLNVYLSSLVGNYTIMNFVASTTLPDLSGYNTIILQETSFDVSGTIFLGPAARTSIKNWLSSGTPSSKKSLISIGADQAYNYSRSGSSAQDLDFADNYGKYTYRVDNGPGTTSPSITGIATDIGNTRPLTSTPAGGAFWPDGCSMSTGGTALYKYQNHTAADTLAAIGNIATNYVVATLFQDPRYFTGGFGNVLAATINWVVSNGGVITGVNNNHVSTIADNYMLAQNYPNPFNPSTKINYTIPKSGLVSIKVFDMLGRVVATLVNEVKNAGTFEITFDGSNYSSGTYFYRIETADFVQTKKMSLLK